MASIAVFSNKQNLLKQTFLPSLNIRSNRKESLSENSNAGVFPLSFWKF